MPTYELSKDFYDSDSYYSDYESSMRTEVGSSSDGNLSLGFIDNFANLKINDNSTVLLVTSTTAEMDMFNNIRVPKEYNNIYCMENRKQIENVEDYEEENSLDILHIFNNLKIHSLVNCSVNTSQSDDEFNENHVKEDESETEIKGCQDNLIGDVSILVMSSGGQFSIYDDDMKDTPAYSRHALYNMKTVEKHKAAYDNWLVIDNCVYDITNLFAKNHSEEKLLGHYAGSDCTVGIVYFAYSYCNILFNY